MTERRDEFLACLERYWGHSARALAWAKFASGFELTPRELENAQLHMLHLVATLGQRDPTQAPAQQVDPRALEAQARLIQRVQRR